MNSLRARIISFHHAWYYTQVPSKYSFYYLFILVKLYSVQFNCSVVSDSLRPLMFKDTVLVCQGCHNKGSQTGWLTQQKFTLSQFWRLEVQNQGVKQGQLLLSTVRGGSIPVFFLGLQVVVFSLCLFTLFFLYVYLYVQTSFFIRIPVILDRAHLNDLILT